MFAPNLHRRETGNLGWLVPTLVLGIVLMAGPASSAQPEAGPMGDPVVPDMDHSDLDQVLGLAVHRASEGRFAEAIEVARTWEGEAKGEAGQRVATELHRLEVLHAVREQFLERCQEEHLKLHLRHGGRTLRGKVVDVADGMITLSSGRSKQVQVPLAALGPVVLVRACRDLNLQVGEDWMPLYAKLLTDRECSKTDLEQAGEAGRELMRDEARYLAWRQIGQAVSRVQALMPLLPPEDAEQAKVVWQRIFELFEGARDTAFVLRWADALKEYANVALSLVFDAEGWAQLKLAGEVQLLGDGRGRVTYEFQEESEGDDFELVHYLDQRRPELGDIVLQEASCDVEKGMLILRGPACVRLPFALSEQQKIEYSLVWCSEPEDRTSPNYVTVGLCDNGNETFIGCVSLGRLILERRGRMLARMPPNDYEFLVDEPYRLSVDHDGTGEVSVTLDGELQGSIPCGRLREGGIFIYSHSNPPVAMDQIVIEGSLSEGTKSDWIEQQLASL